MILLDTPALAWWAFDPADRVIVATAMIHQVPILTKDRAVHAVGGVEWIW